jgi:Mrp family chromosome partitioning ATPase
MPLEGFRNMAYTYLAAGSPHGQAVLFTGIGAAGSSSIGAAQFAVALAQAGTRVVLVDAERTRQVVTNGFGATDKKGLSNVFQDGGDASSMLIETRHKNLSLLPIGTVPEAMVPESGLDRIESVLASLKQHAQVVVVSVAPADMVADAAAFASRVDEVCLSVSARTNEYGSVPTTYEILDKAGARSIKLILTDTGRDGEPFTAARAIQRAN